MGTEDDKLFVGIDLASGSDMTAIDGIPFFTADDLSVNLEDDIVEKEELK